MFLKNKNIIFKIRRSKVTDYAALKIFLFLCWRRLLSSADNLCKQFGSKPFGTLEVFLVEFSVKINFE